MESVLIIFTILQVLDKTFMSKYHHDGKQNLNIE